PCPWRSPLLPSTTLFRSLVASMASAYERGEPWVGYYWEPTWVMGLYDMTLLDEPEYTDECWETTKACAFKAAEVLIGAHAPFIRSEEHTSEIPSRETLV